MLENPNAFQKHPVPVPLPQTDIQPNSINFEQTFTINWFSPNNLYCWVLGTPLIWKIKMFADVQAFSDTEKHHCNTEKKTIPTPLPQSDNQLSTIKGYGVTEQLISEMPWGFPMSNYA